MPDAYVLLNEQGRVAIGEAKTMNDLENPHTEAQVKAFLKRCAVAEGSTLVLIVPWPIERLARSILRHICSGGAFSGVETLVLSDANPTGSTIQLGSH